MTVSRLWIDGEVKTAPNLEDKNYDRSEATLGYNVESPSFKMLQRCTLLCSIAAFNYALPSEKDLSAEEQANMDSAQIEAKKKELQDAWAKEVSEMKIQDRPTVGDASESGLIKFFEPIETIGQVRVQQPIAETNGMKAEIPFTS